MRQIRSDLWETRPDNPFPGLTTHAYLWTGGQHGNVLFYSTATDADFDAITALGGVAHQYLSHRDEAGPQLGIIKERFGAVLHAPAIEETDIGKYAPIDVALAGRHVDAAGIEVIPTPGHTPGSTCYLVPRGQRPELPVHRRHHIPRRGRRLGGRLPAGVQRRRDPAGQPARPWPRTSRPGDLQRLPGRICGAGAGFPVGGLCGAGPGRG